MSNVTKNWTTKIEWTWVKKVVGSHGIIIKDNAPFEQKLDEWSKRKGYQVNLSERFGRSRLRNWFFRCYDERHTRWLQTFWKRWSCKDMGTNPLLFNSDQWVERSLSCPWKNVFSDGVSYGRKFWLPMNTKTRDTGELRLTPVRFDIDVLDHDFVRHNRHWSGKLNRFGLIQKHIHSVQVNCFNWVENGRQQKRLSEKHQKQVWETNVDCTTYGNLA